jgi:hypothetical protein
MSALDLRCYLVARCGIDDISTGFATWDLDCRTLRQGNGSGDLKFLELLGRTVCSQDARRRHASIAAGI